MTENNNENTKKSPALWMVLFILLTSILLYAGQKLIRNLDPESKVRLHEREPETERRSPEMTSTQKVEEKKYTNKLIKEKSPYLLQHAHNPVNWYPWGEEAFKKAKKEDKPIFLSIGYSTCHWCHVMAHESFEDEEVAKLMNDTFICIKVDREERPDIDGIYMNVCQMMTRSGGWPLTIVMTPDKKPFFAGTYFPKESRFGRIGMIDLTKRIKNFWENKREDVDKTTDEIISLLKKSNETTPGKQLDESLLKITYLQLKGRYDGEYAGFGKAPKFPTPHNLLFLLRYWKKTGSKDALEMVEHTLQAMRKGGVFDHLGYGFHRYSTDREWLLPHFEKMLYDQALLALTYTEAYQATEKEEYRQSAEEILNYVLRDMTSKEGGFYSAEDADSEGVEGKFYVWSEDEIIELLGKDDADIFIKVYNVKKEGNFRDEATHKPTGKNILHLSKSLEENAKDLNIPVADLKSKLETSRKKLFDARNKRVRPHLDDKILTDWNGLMIASLAKAGKVFEEPKYIKAAEKAAGFILKKMRKPDGRLLHRYRDGEAGISAYLDDYAFLSWGLLELYEATFKTSYLKTAIDLNNEMIKHFEDAKKGGFYISADDAENLLIRQKEIYDGAIPSGNSVTMLNLLKLSRITGKPEYEALAVKLGKAFYTDVQRMPSANTMLMIAVDFGAGKSYEIVFSGNAESEEMKKMLQFINKKYIPNKVVLFRPDGDSPEITKISGYTKEQVSKKGKPTVYVCVDYGCQKPVFSVEELEKLLEELEGSK